MTEQRSWVIPALPEQHLLPDAVVAFVDGELGSTARQRAEAHFGRCPSCAAELAGQRQARAAVRAAGAPAVPAGLLAALRAIPIDTDLPSAGLADGLAVDSEGQLVAVQRPDRAAGLGAGPMLGSSRPLGRGDTVLRTGHGRRAVQGAGVVAAGLVLGALAMVGPHPFGVADGTPADPPHGDGTAIGGGRGVVAANFTTGVGGSVRDTGGALAAATAVPAPHAARVH